MSQEIYLIIDKFYYFINGLITNRVTIYILQFRYGAVLKS